MIALRGSAALTSTRTLPAIGNSYFPSAQKFPVAMVTLLIGRKESQVSMRWYLVLVCNSPLSFLLEERRKNHKDYTHVYWM